MASCERGGGAPGEAAGSGRATTDLPVAASEQDDQAIGLLPGIVNDLPEVAPHEWIYLMS
ncbi:MAG TPA: hypothetical protein VMM55_12125 [Thermohalobaculum sp.]|nr:hypothetical protein [Thermohalobaculum sp.]